jgi:hypothetical protein
MEAEQQIAANRLNAPRAGLTGLGSTMSCENRSARDQIGAASPLKLTKIRGLAYDAAKAAQAQLPGSAIPGQNGFGFANDQIHRAVDRERAATATQRPPE